MALSSQAGQTYDMTPPGRPARLRPAAVLRAMRPKQWTKNLLVYAAPVAAGVVHEAGPFGRATVAFVAFTAAASGLYLVNDVVDREADRLHPVKSKRPVASGEVPVPVALALSAVLVAIGLAVAGALSWRLLAVVAVYVAITLAYSLHLKQLAVVELGCVASGFILRAVAGGVAVALALSPWFLIVTSFGALFVVAGKRGSEHAVMGEGSTGHRASLGVYPAAFLGTVRAIAASVTVAAYCLWAFDPSRAAKPRLRAEHLIWFELSIVPFVLALLVVELAFERGLGGEPEELALKDRSLQAVGLAWIALLVIGIYT